MNSDRYIFGYLPALDGMRGLAICGIILYHAGEGLGGYKYLKGGFISVDIFFVLSGFLITSLLLREYEKHHRIDLKKFYMRRFLRLFPALVALLLAIMIFSLFNFSVDWINFLFIDSLIVFFYAANWTRAFDMNRPILLGHAWSLSIEEQFYILWPFALIVLLKLFKSKKIILIIALLVALLSWLLRGILLYNGSSIMRLYNGLDTRADALMIGCALAIALSSISILRLRRCTGYIPILFNVSSVIALLALCLIASTQVWTDPKMYKWVFFVVELLSAFILFEIIVFPGSILKKIFEFRLLVWLGRISYGVYLWHYPIFYLMRGFYEMSKPDILIFGTILSLALASISYYFLERPLLRLKKRYQVIPTST